MPLSDSFLDYAKDLFAPFGDISIRRMFGGAGVYCDGAFFAIIANDEIFFKADDVSREEFEARGLGRFTFEMKDGRIESMSYYNAPEEIFDDADELKRWTDFALGAAFRAKKFAKKPKKKIKKRVKRRD
ncbi:MAG: TfoX/Sxy family protein [Parvularculaceae bacterium]